MRIIILVTGFCLCVGALLSASAEVTLAPLFGIYSLVQTLRTPKESRPKGVLFTAIATTIIGSFVLVAFIGAIFYALIHFVG